MTTRHFRLAGDHCKNTWIWPYADKVMTEDATLEDYVAHLNGLAFWKEFTFAQNQFTPRPGQALELADNLVWFGDFAIAIQMKQRDASSEDPEVEAAWFRRKILDKGVKQVRDTLRFLAEHEEISITNEKGHAFEIRGADLSEILKVIVFQPGPALPDALWRKRFHISQTAGFIHLIAAHDYLGILQTLRVPEDIRRYLSYRENVVAEIEDPAVEEVDIMGAFLAEEDAPSTQSRETLARLVQDLEAFDLSRLIASLDEHIEKADHPYDYYRIMQEFARVPRSVWRAVKERFMLSLTAAREGRFTSPYRVAFPASGCSFMIAPLSPDIPATGPEGIAMRRKGLQNLTYAAMYAAGMSKGIGILISMDGVYFQIDWCFLDIPWEQDPQMDDKLATDNPFRSTTEKHIDGFLILPATPPPST